MKRLPIHLGHISIATVLVIQCACSGPRFEVRKLDRNEKEIYELLLKNYGGSLVLNPNLRSEDSEELESIWKRLRSNLPPYYYTVPLTPTYLGAFDDLKTKSSKKWKISPWTQAIKVGQARERSHGDPITSFWFSPVGIDPKGLIAMVIRSGHQGPLAGSTEFIILRKVKKGWEVELEYQISIS